MVALLHCRKRGGTLEGLNPISDDRLLAFSRTLAESVRSGLSASDIVLPGKSLEESLAARRIFPPVFLALIRAGEKSGKIDFFLDRFCEMLKIEIDFRRKIRRALLYPAAVATIVAALFAFFAAAIVPLLVQPIADAGVPLSPTTLAIIRLGRSLLANWPVLLASTVVAATAFSAFMSSRLGRRAGAWAGHWLPGLRFATEEARFYRVASTLELLIGAGLTPQAAIDILSETFRDDRVTFRRLTRAGVLVSDGNSFHESVGSCLPVEDRMRLKVSEKAGRLDQTFGELAKTHRARQLHRLKLTGNTLQIAATAALAPVCFGLIFCLLWPTLSLFNATEKLLSGLASPEPGGLRAATTPPSADNAPEPAFTVEDAASALFNESKAKEIVEFMQATSPRLADAVVPAQAPNRHSPTSPPKPKTSALQPKLKPRPAFRKPSFNKIEATTVRSALP